MQTAKEKYLIFAMLKREPTAVVVGSFFVVTFFVNIL